MLRGLYIGSLLLSLVSLPRPAAAADLRLTIVSARLDAKRHKAPVNPRMRVEIKDRILRTEPLKATLTPRWDHGVTLAQADVKTSRFIDFILYDYTGPGPDDEKMIAGKRLYPKDLLRNGTWHVTIGGADVVYRVEPVQEKAAAPSAPPPPAVTAAPRPGVARVRSGPPIPPLRLFEPMEQAIAKQPPARAQAQRRTGAPTGAEGMGIQQVIDAHSAELDACQSKATDPYGEVALLFSISADGRPLGVLVEKASANLKEVGECMRSKALRWRFPPSHGGLTARHLLSFGR